MHPRSLYTAFDSYPAPKGAATHIRYMAKTLFEHTGSGCLYTLGGEGLPEYQQEGSFEIIRFSTPVANLLERAMVFGQQLTQVIDERAKYLEVCHFRDPWGGLPILNYRHQSNCDYKTVYEVNALPSIELPYAFPHIANSTIEKIAAQEMLCLEHSDKIFTPSNTTAELLLSKGISSEKISLIPNGAEVTSSQPKPLDAPERYLIYFGAIQQWQGVDELLRAFSQLSDFEDLKLVLCVAKHNRIAKQYKKMAERLGIAERVIWKFALPQEELFPWVEHATLSLAPLTDCSRNRLQGCCPLKIVESMAAGTPVVASDLPVVRELIEHNTHGHLVRPGRYHDLALAVRCLLEEPEHAKAMGWRAKQRIEDEFTWDAACAKLTELYRNL